MRIRETIVAAGLLSITAATLAPREAAAQSAPVLRDKNWDIVSNVTMITGAAIVSLMPRVYYNDPEATVGWKGRWHISALAPIMSMTALTWMVDVSVKNAIKSPRPGCTIDRTAFVTECASYGAPSTQSYASWGATGAGTGIFLIDTIKYSDGHFNVPYFIGDVAVPLALSVLTSVGRSVAPGAPTLPHESPGAIAAGALTGFASGLIVGGAYALLQKPSCGFGNNVFCW